MAFVPIRRVRTTQPNGDGIDWGNPLTKGLTFAAIPSSSGQLRDMVSGQVPMEATYSTPAVWKDGRAVSFIGPCTFRAQGTLKSFLAVGVVPDDTFNDHVFIGQCDSVSGATWASLVWIRNYGDPKLLLSSCVLSNFYWVGAAPTKFGERFSCAFNSSGESGYNGKYAAGSYNPYQNPTGDVITLGYADAGGSNTSLLAGTAALFMAWNRDLSKEELVGISANPWQVFL